MEEKERKTDEDYFLRVEEYLKSEQTDWAQYELNHVKGESAEKHFLQSKIYQQKKWYNEQYKQLKEAIKAAPDNEEYKKELAQLRKFKKSGEYKLYRNEIRESRAGNVCEALCDGCTSGCYGC